jgi:hypothetical protein
MDQYAHIRGLVKKRKQRGKYYDFVKTVYVDAKPEILNFANQHRVLVTLGVSSRNYLDNYNKKIGREIAKSKARQVLYRLETLRLVAADDDIPEHFLVTLCLNTDQKGPPKTLLFKSIQGNPNLFLLDATF